MVLTPTFVYLQRLATKDQDPLVASGLKIGQELLPGFVIAQLTILERVTSHSYEIGIVLQREAQRETVEV